MNLPVDAMLLNMELPIRGMAAGLIIAAPVGPVNVLCIQRSLEKGWRAGVVSGLGAAAADTLYGGIAGFSVSLVIGFLIREEYWIRLIGGIILIGIGVGYYFKKPGTLRQEKKKDDSPAHAHVVSTFLLSATNPTTILSFLVVLATLGLAQQRPLWQTGVLVGGIFCGSMAWWVILASGASMLRARVTEKTMLWMNRIGGIAIGAFGLANILLSRGYKH